MRRKLDTLVQSDNMENMKSTSIVDGTPHYLNDGMLHFKVSSQTYPKVSVSSYSLPTNY